MALSTVSDNQLLDKLAEVFRLYGYEGASLSRIAKVTGLQRASLYHRFPGGKQQMAQAVLSRADDWFVNHVLAPLGDKGDPAQRVRLMAQRLGKYFGAGHHSCVLGALSLGGASKDLCQHVNGSFHGWLDAMTAVAKESGVSLATARRRGADALVQIQGALVFARITGDVRPFKRVLGGLPQLLTAADPQ